MSATKNKTSRKHVENAREARRMAEASKTGDPTGDEAVVASLLQAAAESEAEEVDNWVSPAPTKTNVAVGIAQMTEGPPMAQVILGTLVGTVHHFFPEETCRRLGQSLLGCADKLAEMDSGIEVVKKPDIIIPKGV